MVFISVSFLIIRNPLFKAGVNFFVLGVISTETLLFVQDTMFYFDKYMFSRYFLNLLIVSAILVLGIFLLLLQLSFKSLHRKT